MAKTGRNQLCSCGSGKKYKRCCGSFANATAPPRFPSASSVKRVLEQRRAKSASVKRNRAWVVRSSPPNSKIIRSSRSTTRSIFHKSGRRSPISSADYIKRKLDPAWGNLEIAKPLAERHPIMQWYEAYTRYQQATIKTPGEVAVANVTGIVACYLGLAYGLYLLDHNVELQERFIRRLKNPANFQGAYYEFIVASILVQRVSP